LTLILVCIRRKLAVTPLAALASLPARLCLIGPHVLRTLYRSFAWLVRSREHTNLTYELTSLNTEQMAWFVTNITGISIVEARAYIAEIHDDAELRRHVAEATQRSSRRGLADAQARYGRRMAWYAIVRASRPERVVETGTDKGLGACVIAAALLKNGSGRLVTIDINPHSGYLIAKPYADVVDRVVGDSVHALMELTEDVDIFLHDSDHSVVYEKAEIEAVSTRLRTGGLMMSDNSHVTSVLSDWAESRGWAFYFFGERPEAHWYPGDGLGVSRAARW
jgi:predicted O-methyltransferase YrrM